MPAIETAGSLAIIIDKAWMDELVDRVERMEAMLGDMKNSANAPPGVLAAKSETRVPGVMDIEEAAKRLGKGKSTIWAMIKDGRLPKPFTRGGRKLYFEISMIEEREKQFIREGKEAAK